MSEKDHFDYVKKLLYDEETNTKKQDIEELKKIKYIENILNETRMEKIMSRKKW